MNHKLSCETDELDNLVQSAVQEADAIKVERFFGFRFEALAPKQVSPEVIRAKADELFCFGWVQQPVPGPEEANRVVGEVRCGRRAGIVMLNWIQGLEPQLLIKEYPDTKIKFHFSSFEVLDATRTTCFETSPHRCRTQEELEEQYVDPDVIWPESVRRDPKEMRQPKP